MGELVVASDMDIPIGRPSIPRTVAMYSIWSLTEWTKCRLSTIHAARRTMQVGPRSAVGFIDIVSTRIGAWIAKLLDACVGFACFKRRVMPDWYACVAECRDRRSGNGRNAMRSRARRVSYRSADALIAVPIAN